MLFPIRSLHQDRLGCGVESTWPTVSCLFLTMLYTCGYCCRKGLFPSQMSSQNLTWEPFFMVKVPNLRKSFFTFIKLAQKWESPFFQWTCTKGFVPRYLLHRICCHVPYVVNRRYSHLVSKAIFFNSKFCIPKPPCSFGWHRISHLASRYFLLWLSLCQKKRDRISVLWIFF